MEKKLYAIFFRTKRFLGYGSNGNTVFQFHHRAVKDADQEIDWYCNWYGESSFEREIVEGEEELEKRLSLYESARRRYNDADSYSQKREILEELHLV